MSNQKQWESLIKQGQRAYQRQCYAEAERHLGQALCMAEKFEDKGEQLVTSLSEIASFYKISGDLSKADEMMIKAVRVGKKVLNRRDLDSLLRKAQEINAQFEETRIAEDLQPAIPVAPIG